MAEGRKPSRWAIGILASYVVFIGGILGLVYFSMSQKIDLVSEKYYDQGIHYQSRIQALENTRSLKEKLRVDLQPWGLLVRFPGEVKPGPITGKMQLYRPDNQSSDVSIDIAVDTLNCQRVSTSSLAKGLWRLKVDWKANGTDYYGEQVVVLE